MLKIGESTIINGYINWLNDSLINDKNRGIIRTPYKRPDGDFINLRLVNKDNRFYLTDSGDTFDYLYISGIDLHSSSMNRDNIIKRILLSNGVLKQNPGWDTNDAFYVGE